ncbi:hypothetical protein LNI89_06650 [Tenacibaculum dicentrarchi]|nr:hypothetical protein [Tenacibaculum dicentrarchi]MCD8420166.1 hypothetical protein [Tenacibaculum dicentrarchi]
MMKLYKLLFFLLIIPAVLAANNSHKKHEKNKTIRKNFSVNENATLYINNKYGNIQVSTWNKNSIEIEVKIIVKGDNINNVKNKLNAINIVFQASKNLVEARTKIEKSTSNWSWWGSNNINYKINYHIKIPTTSNADLNNKYGNIELDSIKGKATINCNYGNVEIDELLNDSNTINLDYCGNAEINFIKSGTINMDYSKLKINNSKSLNINADYATVKIGKTKKLKFNSDYGNLSLDNVSNLTVNSDYTNIKIKTLKKNLTLNTNYGAVKVENIEKNFNKIIIDGNYTSIKLGANIENNFNFKINLGYANFKYPNEKTIIFKSIEKNSTKYYEGVFGKTTNSNINIKSNYGGVSIKLNE